MKHDLIFNKDFNANSIYVMTVYDTDIPNIWDYFTQPGLLDLWWAPKPWACKTVSQDFNEGGIWLYAMAGPDGKKHYARIKYGEITEHRSFDATDASCDENGNPDESFPQVQWLIGFTGVEEGAKVTVNIHFQSEEEMKKILETGFEEGFTTGLKQLEKLLTEKS